MERWGLYSLNESLTPVAPGEVSFLQVVCVCVCVCVCARVYVREEGEGCGEGLMSLGYRMA